ncbi:GIY-YIG nuclease family protein, partial [Maribacter dokdonensis]|uniref:GIY-YIG nuclease family protein n=1 Tax=Maribacter dokdonensis TaxID=320912 RepID=UPI002091E17F
QRNSVPKAFGKVTGSGPVFSTIKLPFWKPLFILLFLNMNFTTYIIYSKTLNCYYVGSTENIDTRLLRHNNGNGSSYTKKASDWVLKWQRNFKTRSEAVSFELLIKKKKSRKYIEYLISIGIQE